MEDVVVITGGSVNPKSVGVYNIFGWLEDFPDLKYGRWGHGCGHYANEQNNRVIKSYDISQLKWINQSHTKHHCIVKVYIVSGGYDGRNLLASTEIYLQAIGSWITLTSAELPFPRQGLRGVSLNNMFYLTGN